MELREEILKQIKKYKLTSLGYEGLISQLTVLNNKPHVEIKKIVDNLIGQGKIKLKKIESQNTVVRNFKRDKNGPKSPYSTGRDENIDLAYDILNKKDRKTASKSRKVEGKIQMTSKGYAFLLPTDINIEDIFIAEKDLCGAMHNDKVVVSVKGNGGRREEGKVIQVLERGSERVVGVLEINKKIACVKPDDVKFGKDISIPLSKLNGASHGEKVVVKITRYYASKRNPDGEIVEVLGKPNDIDTEVLAILRSYNLYNSFPKKVEETAKYVPESISVADYPQRLNYTNNIVFTIDGEDTRDIDDAISIEINSKGNRVLGVHIADVGEYVTKDNVLDKEAFKRGTSVYFPNLVLPMLPRELSNGICSLNERVDRLALSCFIEYDKNANVVNTKVCESVINSKKRFTYTEVQKIFDGDHSVARAELVDALLKMRVLAGELEKKRVAGGAIEFNIPEVQISLNELGDVLNLSKREHNESHKLIETFMIEANVAIATMFLSKKIPFVYRIHEQPDGEKINRLIGMVNNFGVSHNIEDVENCAPKDIQNLLKSIDGKPCEYVLNKIALRCMKKAKYSPDCVGHYGLAIEKYCHFTSPIRRYPDLTIHRIIKDYLHNEITDNKKALLKEFVNISSIQSSETERNAESVERDVDDLYRVVYMSHHIGDTFDGIISSVTNFGVFVELENTCEGMIRIEDLPQDQYEYLEDRFTLKGYKRSFTIGDKLTVKNIRADILSREIDFELVL